MAASALAQALHVARMARYDLLRPTCRPACHITRWSAACYRRMFQLIRYAHSTYRLRQAGWVSAGLVALAPRLYADADLAGDADTQNSTAGIHLAIRGPRASFPTCGISKRQGCV